MISLHPYQARMKNEVYDLVRKKLRKIPIIGATGSGKTVVAGSIAADIELKGLRTLFLVDRDTLVNQTQKEFKRFGIECGIIKADHPDHNPEPCKIQNATIIASMQTLQVIPKDLWPQKVDALFFDEMHTTLFRKLAKEIQEHYNNPYLLGITATPWRQKKTESLSQIFDPANIVMSPTPAELMDHGYLARDIYFRAKHPPSVTETVMVNGKIVSKKKLLDLKTPEMIEYAIQQYLKLCPSRHGLIFAQNVRHSKNIANAFNRAGIPTLHIDGGTEDREDLYDALRHKTVRLMSNCKALSTGFNIRFIDVLIDLAGTRSRSEYVQRIGRVLRSCEGKEDAYIIDQACNAYHRFGYISQLTTDHYNFDDYDIVGTPKEPPLKVCKECNAMNPISARKCIYCDNAFPLKGKSNIDIKAMGDMIRATQKPSNMRQEYSAMIKDAYNRGASPGMALYNFKEKHNRWPTKEEKFTALFGDYSLSTQKLYLEWLTDMAQKRGEDKSWIKRMLKDEFGPFLRLNI